MPAVFTWSKFSILLLKLLSNLVVLTVELNMKKSGVTDFTVVKRFLSNNPTKPFHTPQRSSSRSRKHWNKKDHWPEMGWRDKKRDHIPWVTGSTGTWKFFAWTQIVALKKDADYGETLVLFERIWWFFSKVHLVLCLISLSIMN